MASFEITKNDVELYVLNGGPLEILTKDQIEELSQDTANQYALNGGKLGLLSERQASFIPYKIKKIVRERENALLDELREKFAQKTKKDLSFESLAKEDVSGLSQKLIGYFVSKGKNILPALSPDQKNGISLEEFESYIANGGALYDVPEDILNCASQDAINARIERGYEMYYLPEKRVERVPNKIINDHFAEGCDIEEFEDTGVDPHRISQRAVDIRAARGIIDDEFLLDEQIESIPEEIYEYSEDMKNAVILYGAGKISREEIPFEVYANPDTRKALLGIVKHKAHKQFDEIREEHYGESYRVPEELVSEFDDYMKKIEKDFEIKMRVGVSLLEGNELAEDEINLATALVDVRGMKL